MRPTSPFSAAGSGARGALSLLPQWRRPSSFWPWRRGSKSAAMYSAPTSSPTANLALSSSSAAPNWRQARGPLSPTVDPAPSLPSWWIQPQHQLGSGFEPYLIPGVGSGRHLIPGGESGRHLVPGRRSGAHLVTGYEDCGGSDALGLGRQQWWIGLGRAVDGLSGLVDGLFHFFFIFLNYLPRRANKRLG